MVILLSVFYTLGLVTSFAVCFLKGKPVAGVVGVAAWVLPMLMTLGYLSGGLPASVEMCLENQLLGSHLGTPDICGESSEWMSWAVLFWFTSPIWATGAALTIVGAIQWAKPDSRWAKVFYAKDDMAIARRQFPDAPVPAPKGRHNRPA